MRINQPAYAKPVYVVDGVRTPFLKARGVRGLFSAADLAIAASNALLLRQPFTIKEIDEIILGCVMPAADEANIARVVGLRLGCDQKTPAWTVQRNCGSGMQSIDSACQSIVQGRSHLVLAGGTEAMSRASWMLSPALQDWLVQFKTDRRLKSQIKKLLQLRPHYFKPIIGLAQGLTDPVVGVSMGQTAEILADQFHITRQQMDEFALRSHQRLATAQSLGELSTEITPLYSQTGAACFQDDGVRVDTSLSALSHLKPFFDKPFGLVTAGNSSQISDGASMLILASEEAVKQYQLPVLGQIRDCEWVGLDPKIMGLGPVFAASSLLKRQNLTNESIDYWEINEAFAAQTLACLEAWQDENFCRKHLNLESAWGEIDAQRLNIDGGAIALGHPVGASGARLVLHVLNRLKREQTKLGVATLCIGGGQGGAMLLERA